MTRTLWLPLAACLASCGGSATPSEHPEPTRHRAGHHAHGGHGRHGAHDHSSPEALRPLMRDLFARMGELHAALEGGDVEATQREAHAIAIACDDQDVHAVDPERFGPRFAEIDQELHAAAAAMAESAQSGDLDAARSRYAALHSACVACHAQAPTAQEVDLSSLAPRASADSVD